MLARALLAFIALPGLVGYVVPLALAWPVIGERPFRWLGLIPLLAGTGLLLWSVREFYIAGKGTLAPWDPPRHLVSSGLYRFSRNPMYIAVSLVLLGWASGFASRTLLFYALVAIAVFHIRVVFFEEPWLARTHRTEWKQYSPTVPRWMFRSRRAVAIAWAALILSFPLAGLAYEIAAEAAAAREFAPSGQLVDIGGRRLHLVCMGDGPETVFFESSGWGTALSSAAARTRLSRTTRVCSYDRSGNGWSDPGPSVASAQDLARNLAVLQDRASVPWPFVIVASSIGGLTAEMYARQFPERTAGLVLVDAATSLSLPILESISGRATASLCTTSVLARFGVVRLADPFGLAGKRESRQAAAMAYGPGPWGQLCAMARGLDETREAFQAAPELEANLPIAVLSASSLQDLVPPAFARLVDAAAVKSALEDSHKRFAQQSTRGSWQLVPESTHLIGESQPDAVVEAVLTLLDGR